MFDNLPANVKELAKACFDQCSIDEIREDRDYPTADVMSDYSVNELEWTQAHDAAITAKEVDIEMYKVTSAQIFNHDDTCSVNLEINDKFIVQVGTDGVGSIPDSDCCCLNEEDQDFASENINPDNVIPSEVNTDYGDLVSYFEKNNIPYTLV